MVKRRNVRALRFFNRVHETREAIGRERLTRRLAKRRTAYRWIQQLRGQISYYPRIAFTGLGLVHVHCFISDAGPEWLAYPYAIDGVWTVDAPGHHVLYLHCLLPREQLALAPAGEGICSITTGEGWQDLAPLETALTAAGRPRYRTAQAGTVPAVPATSIVQDEPFLVPVACELLMGPASMDDLWGRIRERLGKRVWPYFSRQTRRWPRNGKTYVRAAFGQLNRYGLVLQHVIQYAPVRTHTVEVLIHVTDNQCLRDELAGLCPAMESYATSDGYLLRVSGDDAMLKRVISATGARHWWFIDHNRTAPPVRFAYETLFDPRTKSWTVTR